MDNIPKGQTNSLFNSPAATNIANTATSAVKNTATNVTNTIKDSVQNMGNKPETIIGLIVVIIFAGIVAWLMYRFVTQTVFNQSKLVVSETKLPVLCNKLNKFTLDYKLPSGNGLKRTYTFWIYIKDMSHQYFKNVLYIGSENSLKNRSPQIFLDKTKNKLYIRFNKKYNNVPGSSDIFADKEEQPSIESMFGDDVDNGSYTEFRKYMEQGMCIEYIPIQRWVHIGIVVNDFGTSSGGNISTYIDGELVGIAEHGEPCRGIGIGENPHTYDIINLDLDGGENLVIGGNFDTDNTPGFSGLICKFTMFNYDLNDRDIYNNYNEGPIDNVMAKLGLGAYGLRSPIYRIS